MANLHQKFRGLCVCTEIDLFENARQTFNDVLVNETYTKSLDRVILEEDPDKKIPNAVLIINEVQMSDRGIYKCIAFSNVTKTEESVEVMVRIKGK